MTNQIYSLLWNDIAITISYDPQKHDAIAHIEIRRDDGGILPITETGYRSHFIDDQIIQDYGGVQSYVRAWLDDAAKSKKWIKALEASKQLTLF